MHQLRSMNIFPNVVKLLFNIFNIIDGIQQKYYIIAVGHIILPTNIIFVFLILNNRFCIFLKNIKLVDHITTSSFVQLVIDSVNQ